MGVLAGLPTVCYLAANTMADTKGANISRMVLKQAGRAKEKILQNLGKADKTTDEIFEEHLMNFNTQQVNSTRLHKDINNYLRCIRAMQTASKNLMETLSDIYEKEWVGQDMLYVQAQNNEMLWADLAHKLSDQVVIPLNTYQAQFPEMRKKIDKRGRKLIDFDAERHSVQQMQNNPNRNEAKFVRAKESMETAKVYGELEGVVDKLAKEAQRGTLPRKTFPKPLPITNHSSNSNLSSNVITTNGNNLSSPPKATNGGGRSQKYSGGLSPTKDDYEPVRNLPESNGHSKTNGSGHSYDIPAGATTDNLPPGVLYQVKAAYKYQAEDMDELQFEVGEVIDVVEYDDPEEQEEGWLMGVRSSTGQKGLFPANFTRPI